MFFSIHKYSVSHLPVSVIASPQSHSQRREMVLLFFKPESSICHFKPSLKQDCFSLKQSVATGRIYLDYLIIICGAVLFSNINDCINNKITSYSFARCNSFLIPDLLMF